MTKTNNIGKNYFVELKNLLHNSMCTFSGVSVAAIIVTDKGVFKGVNYEDPVTNLGICAERNAIFNAITNGMNRIYEIHLISSLSDISMCGACRQVASTFAKPSCKIYTYDYRSGVRTMTTLGKLLPDTFGIDTIKGKKMKGK